MNIELPSDPRPRERTPEFYRWLASELVINKSLWAELRERCAVVSAAQLYGHQRWETAAAVALKGYGIGMSFMEALSKIQVIEGRPTLRGADAVSHIHKMIDGALCRNITALGDFNGFELSEDALAGLRAMLEEHYRDCWVGSNLDPSKISVWAMKRPGWATRIFMYTMAQARSVGLPSRNDRWNLYPDRCVKWQAASIGTQEMFGDVLGGMYLTEEIENTPVHGPLSAPAPPPPTMQAMRKQAAPTPAPAPAPARNWREGVTPPEAIEKAKQEQLDKIGNVLRGYGISYAVACAASLGYMLGDEAPSDSERLELLGWLDQISALRSRLFEGHSAAGVYFRVAEAQYGLFRGLIEEDGKDGKAILWTGAARSDKALAVREGLSAAVIAVLGEPLPDAGEDDEPDPEKVAADDAALAEELERIRKNAEELNRIRKNAEEQEEASTPEEGSEEE